MLSKVVVGLFDYRCIQKYKTEILFHLQQLVAIPSVNAAAEPGKPFGEAIASALQYMLDLGKALNFRTANINGYAGHIEWGEGEEYVAIAVHLDVVAAGTGWDSDPFELQLQQDKLIGRGVSDNKGPAVVALYALVALRDQIPAPERKIRIIFGTDEESGMRDLDYYFQQQPLPLYAFTPDAAYPIINAEKGFSIVTVEEATTNANSVVYSMDGGDAANVVPEYCRTVLVKERMNEQSYIKLQQLFASDKRVQWEESETEIVFEYEGQSGHASYPPSGINAVLHSIDLLLEAKLISVEDKLLYHLGSDISFDPYGERLGIAHTDAIHGKTTINVANIRLNNGQALATYNIRYPVTLTKQQIYDPLIEKYEQLGLTMREEKHMEPLYLADDHPLITKLQLAYEQVTKEPATLRSIGGGTYARKLQQRGVAFGAGFPGRVHGPGAHQPNECTSLTDLMEHAEICTQALFELQKKEPC